MTNHRLVKDITGQSFSRWTVIERAGTRSHTKCKPAMWRVRCECGNESIRAGIDLRGGHTTGCGCKRITKRTSSYRSSNHHAWKGGRSIDEKGYIWICRSLIQELYPHAKFTSNRGMFEHRAVMSDHLRRSLLPGETVHHRNGNRQDNSIENLELRAGKHGPGQSIPDLVAWAKEILARYDP